MAAALEAEEEEVDIEGVCEQDQWLELKSSADEEHGNFVQRKRFSDSGLLHPGSTPFSSEYCDPSSWLLDESVWSLDHCRDEKSRATIEKMILEEEMYLRGLTRVREVQSNQRKSYLKKGNPCNEKPVDQRVKRPTVKSSTSACQRVSHRKPWTKEEQGLFEKGLTLYGRSWTRISSIIPNRTSLQVKNYANQYFRNKKKQPNTEGYNTVLTTDPLTTDCEPNQTLQAAENIVTTQSMEDSIAEDDEDVEIDIDGPDCEENMSTALAGKKLSPDEVYSALLKAATEDKDNGEFFSREENSENEDNSSEEDSQSYEESCEQEDKKGSETCTGNDENISAALPNEHISPVGKIAPQNIDGNQDAEGPEDQSNEDTQSEIQRLYSDVSVPKEILCASENNQNELLHLSYQEDENLENSECTDDGNAMSVLSVPIIFLPNTVEENEGPVLEDDMESVDFNVGKALSNPLPNPLEKVCEPETGMGQSAISSCFSVAAFEQVSTSDREQPVAQLPVSPADLMVLNISKESILEEEKISNMEFFMGRSPKTPERYMKIRNYILDAWEKTKPSYLYKTSLRTGLRNCGDVNSIGRVHSFLEDIGAINVGCLDRPAPRTKHRSEMSDEQVDLPSELLVNSLRPRKRKVRSEQGDWMDESEAEGLTIEHLDPDEQLAQTKHEENVASPRKRLSRTKHSYDPFQLIPCRKFPSVSAVPFEVTIQSNTLVIMDIHAHMSTTEVIGLLGGQYCHQSHTLQISEATPCCSISTGMQCEMDPVSQTQACERLAGRGCTVVGWYHSHPRFAANPSVRDIETQAKFQEWFAKGGSPFIGVIVSPYNDSNISNQSQIRCLTVSNEWSEDHQYRIPYQFDYRVSDSQATEEYVLDEIHTLVDMYRSYPFRVKLSQGKGQFSIIDKLLASISCHMHGQGEEEKQNYLIKIRHILLQEHSTSMAQEDPANPE